MASTPLIKPCLLIPCLKKATVICDFFERKYDNQAREKPISEGSSISSNVRGMESEMGEEVNNRLDWEEGSGECRRVRGK